MDIYIYTIVYIYYRNSNKTEVINTGIFFHRRLNQEVPHNEYEPKIPGLGRAGMQTPEAVHLQDGILKCHIRKPLSSLVLAED